MAKKEFLVCIDSDGCAFDTMELKHKECFCPAYIKYFGLQPVSKYAREAWDFANLYSRYRGIHRLRSLLKALEVLGERDEVAARGFSVPAMEELRAYVEAGNPLSHTGLEASLQTRLDAALDYLKEHPDSREIRNVLDWSVNVNDRVRETVHGVPPFPYVRACLERLSETADIVIVSATQQLSLEREWEEGGLLSFVSAVKGQESGSKKEIIASIKGRYAPDHVLMIGDAPGDREAASANGVLFYPICPDREAESWEEFESCYMERFLNLTYGGDTEAERIAHFETVLPAEPAWKKGDGK